jgi:cell division septum initiation protein DivIVA
MSKSDEIAELRAELAELKKMVNPPQISDAEVRQHMADAHRMRERQASRMSSFSREQIAAMDAACPPSVASDIVRRGGVPGPSAAGASGEVAKVSQSPGLPGSHNGWREATPISPPPGVALADRLMAAQDAKDRHELIVEEARRKAALKLAGRE